DLRRHAGELDLVEEDATGMPPALEHVDLVRDSRPGRVDEVEEWDADPGRSLLDAHDLLDGPSAPAAGLHRRVVCHHRHLAAVDGAEPGDDAARGQLRREDVGEQAVLDEGVLVKQQVEALARGQLVLLTQLRQVARPTLERFVAKVAMPRTGHYLPLKSGSRFSKKALMPSRESSV